MNSSQVESNLQVIIENFSKEGFIFDLLLAYGLPKATITLLQKGRHNLSKKENQVILKKKLFFQEVENEDLHVVIDSLQKDEATMRHGPRFIIVTDYKTLLAVDTKTKGQLDIDIQDIAKHYDFFLPWAGIEKHKHKSENPADRKAAERMAKLYDGILADNNILGEERTHDLNVFLSRLLFCFFSEDTNIFEEGLFTSSVASHTQADGSDLHEYLEKLFVVLNTKEVERAHLPAHFQKFPYVNGGLFAKKHWIPRFSAKARKTIIECGELNWKEINPDIFGSMIQAVVHPGQRGSLGMHYTSVPNIMKVIEPLFLNELKEELAKSEGNEKKLMHLIERMSKMKFFDPACGSGNFLIITYKELRRLEMEIIEDMGTFSFSALHLSQFYGIEIDDFAHEIAKLSLYLAEHQMNTEFKSRFSQVKPTLPLKESGNIVCGNATRLDWEVVCPKKDGDEIYILGNPPYLGARMQDKEQKKDIAIVYSKYGESTKVDYIFSWFLKASEYIHDYKNLKYAFVSTNSICQGEQVALLWKHIFDKNLEIDFAHTSFKWENNAKGNAGVTVIIVGLRNINSKPKYLYIENSRKLVKNINPYLIDANNSYVFKRTKALSCFPKMEYGNMAIDGGNLILSTAEKDKLMEEFPNANIFIKKAIGAQEFIKGIERYCLWIPNEKLSLAESIYPIKKRIDDVKKFRLSSSDEGTHKIANRPHQFREMKESRNSIIVPTVTSERRDYLPIGFLTEKENIIAPNQAIYDAEPWIFGVISSKMHMIWVRAVAGRLKTDYRYSSALCYNTFPITLTVKQKEELTRHVYTILEEREKHSEKTMAQLYDPDKMPKDLKEAHHSLDLAVEQIYRSKPFTSDEERLEYLFGLYEKMVEEEKISKK